MGLVGALDRGQRRFPPVGLPLAVVYKFFDDQGAYLAAIITYYAFVAVFPLLLLASSILGFLLQDNPELQQQVLDSALAQFPIVGDQLGRPEGLTGSTSAVVVGSLVALYGSLGLGTAAQNAMNVAWSVPRNSRPNPILLRLRSLFLLVVAGSAVLGLTALSIAIRETGLIGGEDPPVPRWVVSLAAALVLALVLTLLFRVAAARDHPWWYAVPGGLFVAIGWQVLQVASTTYVNRVLIETSAMNQTFGLVLGLIGLIFLAAVIAVLGIELNVVVTRRLWPRALLTPFTDGVELTPADERAYASYAKAQRHKGFEQVVVVFDKAGEAADDDDPSASR
ncbi:YihY family inner membrane protein [Nocardioides massiliensis]|uniref:YihY family inner membrane protein n=3 Tax=Nocardioides massiliensis TaxID=1325935 RepID=A0ABT9NKU5_9ACTN|nr:YihY/virulence factor BrkB family protein [Nocardioides massiliensis]MDP9820650.1 YihY family inner membrane protein [Nocardioides massiliensis]